MFDIVAQAVPLVKLQVDQTDIGMSKLSVSCLRDSDGAGNSTDLSRNMAPLIVARSLPFGGKNDCLITVTTQPTYVATPTTTYQAKSGICRNP